MAPKTIKKLICDTLENLLDTDLEKFRAQLVDRREEPLIPRSKVQGKSFLVLTDVIVSTFCEVKGLQVTLQTLGEIDCNEEAERLESRARENGHMGPVAHGAASSDGHHFVDAHRDKLIQKVTLVEPILDVLLHEKVIQQELYDTIRAEKTSQAQMRELYRIIGPRGTKCKDIFYKALQEKNPFIVEELEGSK